MAITLQAVFENGVFRPVEQVNLPEHTSVELQVQVVTTSSEQHAAPMSEGLAKVYAILGERYESGHADTAARHNEHQP